MKKFYSLFLICIILISSSFCVSAEEEILAILPETNLAEGYLEPSVQLFSSAPSLEEVITEGWENLDSEIIIRDYGLLESELNTFYKKLCFENPHLYYVSNGCSYARNSSGVVTRILPVYDTTDKAAISEVLSAVEEETENILMLIDDHMTDYEKILTVHDYMVLHYEYDLTYSIYDITIMTKKTGVCQAYSYAFKHIMNQLGIECGYVSSDAMNHGWNIVKVDGKWYHIDITWDDPTTDKPGQVRHTYTFLSDEQIQTLENPHYGYSAGGLTADSSLYDNALWHENVGSIVTIGDVEYWAENYQVVSSEGDIICSDVDGSNDKWNLEGGYTFSNRAMYVGLAEYNDILYYNTDTEIKSYNPKTKKTKIIKEITGLVGLYIDKNTLKYSVYDVDENKVKEGGTIKLGKTRIGGVTHKNGKAHVRVYNEENEPLIVYSFGENGFQMQKANNQGLSHLSFDTENEQTFFFWNENMQPLAEKKTFK